MKTNIKNYQNTIEKIKKTKEIIDFSMQLALSIKSGSIKPEHICKQVNMDNKRMIDRDWTKSETDLKDDFAITAKIAITSYAIIMLKESYAALHSNSHGIAWANKEDNPDLYSAQKILQVVRNALGHMKSIPDTLEAKAYWNFRDSKDEDLFEIKQIEVVLDTRILDGQEFSWNQLGGLNNFLKVLDFLEQDLQNRLKSCLIEKR